MESNRRCPKKRGNRAPAENTVSAKRIADRPLQSELEKNERRKGRVRLHFKKVERDKKQQQATRETSAWN